ncbi:uncharacterized protein O3C94_003240 [Discoglossus pictus]
MVATHKLERAGEHNNFVKRVKTENSHRERMETFFEMFGGRSKGQDFVKYHRSQCVHMSQPWIQRHEAMYSQNYSSEFSFKVFTGPLRPMYPEHNLFRYISGIYKCCRLGFTCRKIKGLQGTLKAGDGKEEVDFYIDADVYNLSILQAELHLEVSASEGLTVIPVLTAKGVEHSRFRQLRSDHLMDLALDVKFLLQILKDCDTEDTMKEEMMELRLALHCIQNEHVVPCDLHGVSLLHSPFIALHYE